MTHEELVAAAMHAALLQQLYPRIAAPPQVIQGPRAATVTMLDQAGDWIVAIHLNDASNGDWHITGDLPPHAAATAAYTYAHTGL